MPAFKQSLWDGSDLEYAPCIKRVNGYFYWRAPVSYLKRGWAIKSMKLEGREGDGLDLQRAERCRELTREMLREMSADDAKVRIGTWHWLIAMYRSDSLSPYQRVKGNTRKDYAYMLNLWDEAIGEAPISKANYRAGMRWKAAMEANGRSGDHIHRMFTMLRGVVNFGALMEDAECIRFAGVLKLMRIPKPKAKSTTAEPHQVMSIIQAAQAERGTEALVLGWMMQWWFSLRAVDVRGQWEPIRAGDEETGGITNNGQRWIDGLTWNHIDPDVTTISKVISKTGRPVRLDLTQVPEVRDRLLAIPPEKRTGPVIISPRSGLPYTRHGWAQAWRKFRKIAGVPEYVKNMDERSGALTDGRNKGASAYDLRDAAGHTNITTTDRYVRAADQARAEVVKLRRN